MIFLFVLFFGVFFLFYNIRQISPNNKGSIIALIMVILLPICFICREFLWASIGQAFFSVWLCESLLIYLFWDFFLILYRIIIRNSLSKRVKILVAQLLLVFTFLITIVMFVFGISNNKNYVIQETTINLARMEFEKESVEKLCDFTVLFFSDLHLDLLFDKSKLKRMIHDAHDLKPDFIVFGGDFADVHDSVLKKEGYDSLLFFLANESKYGAYAINGNHEGYMEQRGSKPKEFLEKLGWIFLDDSTICTQIACITGRTDFQVAKIRDYERKPLKVLAPENLKPWIIVDHQPKGLDSNYVGRIPDIVLSGHTHNGQFFPGTLIIDWVWNHAYGLGLLDSAKWLVSSGVSSWGPPIRVGSQTEMWFIRFVYN